MTRAEREDLIRRYASSEVTWSALRDRHGFRTYLDVLAGLGELGLRPPMAPMSGPNEAARRRGIALLRQRLQDQPSQ